VAAFFADLLGLFANRSAIIRPLCPPDPGCCRRKPRCSKWHCQIDLANVITM